MNESMMQESETGKQALKWYQIPVLWLALLIFIAMLIACIHMIVISSELEAKKITEGERYILGVPLEKQSSSERAKQ